MYPYLMHLLLACIHNDHRYIRGLALEVNSEEDEANTYLRQM
jgi:hypothetical protein